MKRTKAEIMEDLGEYEKKHSKVIANNTVEYWTEKGHRIIRLHKTDIVKFMTDRKIILNSGGWKTGTTKERINRCLDYIGNLYQEKGIWYLHINRMSDSGSTRVFHDGITIDTKNMEIISDSHDDNELVKRQQAERKSIKEFCKNYISELYAGTIPPPGPGDCWFCSMKDQETGLPLGEKTGDPEHIHSHIEEKYYVPSLLMRALEVNGSPIDREVALKLMNGYPIDWAASVVRVDLKRRLRRYIYQQLGHAY